jgi:hypothetical protein
MMKYPDDAALDGGSRVMVTLPVTHLTFAITPDHADALVVHMQQA